VTSSKCSQISSLIESYVVQFIANLPDASMEQIEDNNDVCSICLYDMKSAKITPCNHLYHEMCLRKWLSTKTDCPLCKEKITITNHVTSSKCSQISSLIESYLYKRNKNKQVNVCPITIAKLDAVKFAIEYTFTRRSTTTTGQTINNV
jgi:hypothetical protein